MSTEDDHYAMLLAAYEDACERDRYVPIAPCPACFESCGFAGTWHTSWDDPYGSFFEDRSRPCPECNGSGYVEAEQITLEDLENIAAEEVKQ